MDHSSGGQGRKGMLGNRHMALRVAQIHRDQGAYRGQGSGGLAFLQRRFSRGEFIGGDVREGRGGGEVIT